MLLLQPKLLILFKLQKPYGTSILSLLRVFLLLPLSLLPIFQEIVKLVTVGLAPLREPVLEPLVFVTILPRLRTADLPMMASVRASFVVEPPPHRSRLATALLERLMLLLEILLL